MRSFLTGILLLTLIEPVSSRAGTSEAGNCFALVRGGSGNRAETDLVLSRLNKLYAENSSFRRFTDQFLVDVAKIHYWDGEADITLARQNQSTLEQKINLLKDKMSSRGENSRQLLTKIFEFVSRMDIHSEFPDALARHLTNMVSLVSTPYGKAPPWVNEPPDIYFRNKFLGFINQWIAGTSESEDFSRYFSTLDSKKPLRTFVVYELIKEWDVCLWTIEDFD